MGFLLVVAYGLMTIIVALSLPVSEIHFRTDKDTIVALSLIHI